MSNDKKDSHDLTRIEDLSDFLHDESEEISLLEDKDSDNVEPEKSMMDLEKESFGDSTTFMQIPDELSEQTENSDELNSFDEPDFENENSFDDFSDDSQEEITEDFSQEFDSTFEDDFDDNTEDQSAEFESDFTTDFEENSLEQTSDPQESFESDFENEKAQTLVEDQGSKDEDDFMVALDQPQNVESPKSQISETITPPKDYKEPEKLEDVKEFAQIVTSTNLSIEGNPPFSIIVSKIKYSEDADSILEILKEYQIVKDEHLQETMSSLQRGQILIPRLSEYSAIILCHKLRRFDLNLKMGLSHEIHTSSTFEKSDKGLISKTNIKSSLKKFEDFTNEKISSDQVQVTSQAELENASTLKNITMKSRSKLINNDRLNSDFDNVYNEVQDELIEILKEDAVNLEANALLNVKLSLINNSENKTNFICTANIALVAQS